jgi:hypothetical protein
MVAPFARWCRVVAQAHNFRLPLIATRLWIVVFATARFDVFDRVPKPCCPLWQSSLLRALIDSGRPYNFYAMEDYYLHILPWLLLFESVSICYFEQVIRYRFPVSRILAHLTSTNSRVYSNFEQECEYQIPSWVWLDNLVAILCFCCSLLVDYTDKSRNSICYNVEAALNSHWIAL